MENMESKTPVLNDLIRLNNDRIAGYEQAIKQLDGATHLQSVFHKQIVQSYAFITALEEAIENTGGQATMDQSTTEGKIFRSWMDMKTFFAKDDRKAILESCVDGENAIYQAYQEASQIEELPQDAQFLINQQKQQLHVSNHTILQLYKAEESV